MCSPARDLSAGYHAVSGELIAALVTPHLAGSGVIRWLWTLCESLSQAFCWVLIRRRGKVIAETEHEEDIVYARIGRSELCPVPNLC